MILPKLNIINTSRDMVDVFGGYNHNLRIGSNEFYDMKNMTSDYYPVLSPRDKRGYVTSDFCTGIISKDALCYTNSSGAFVKNGRPNYMELTSDQKQLVSMGAYVIILPDKKWYNTANDTCGNIDESVTVDSVELSLCDINAVGYDAEPSLTPPTLNKDQEEGKEKAYWVDTSSSPHVLKQYSAEDEYWMSVPTTYIKISCKEIGSKFDLYDGIEISGIGEELEKTIGTTVIWAKGDDYIVVPGMLDSTSVADGSITIKREMPDMDFVVESGNRLWGCKYGIAEDGTPINEIYASKLGDFKNWKCFMGISTDSYAASCGTDGPFTGAITHLGYPLFFKEHCVHKVYGNYPANYQIQTTECRGVEQGSHRSLAIVNETLFYKSRSGICAYDGSLPVEVSVALGEEVYHDAVAGALGNKYYVAMRDTKSNAHMFVYDVAKGLWHKEDYLYPEIMCEHKGDLYFAYDYYIGKMHSDGQDFDYTDESLLPWSITSGVMGLDSPDRKFVSRLNIRMSLDVGATATLYAEYDSSGTWENIGTLIGKNLQTFTIPIIPRRCDHFRLMIDGRGNAKIYSITKTTEGGSDVGCS